MTEPLSLVEVGDDLWLRLDLIEGVRGGGDGGEPPTPGLPMTYIFVIGNEISYASDWPIDKVLKALGKEGAVKWQTRWSLETEDE